MSNLQRDNDSDSARQSEGESTTSEQGSFWSRQNPKDRATLIALCVNISVSLVLGLTIAFTDMETMSVGKRLGLLTINLVALFTVLQFVISRYFEDQNSRVDKLRDDIASVTTQLSEAMTRMERITKLSDTYVKISSQESRVKTQFHTTLDNFLTRLSNCIDDKRSGALDIMDYYEVLHDHASMIESDKSKSSSKNYKGEIWALSFVLDDEWDGASLQEQKWFEAMQRLDQLEIPTRRLWVFDKKMLEALKQDPVREDGRELIKRLSLYCADDSPFKHTVSFTVPKTQVSDEHVKLFGKGFFAIKLSNDELSLVRGVCFDNLLASNSLGGEIDFDTARIKRIRKQWENYLRLGTSLRQYVEANSSASAKELMADLWSART